MKEDQVGLRYHGVVSWQIVLCFLLQSGSLPQCFSVPWTTQRRSLVVAMSVRALQCLRLEIDLLSELDASSGQGIGMEASCYSEGLQLD